jgi:hypothetical protein
MVMEVEVGIVWQGYQEYQEEEEEKPMEVVVELSNSMAMMVAEAPNSMEAEGYQNLSPAMN